MAVSNSAWGIEVGSYAVKALRLERSGDGVTVTDFAYIPHKKVLSTPDLDRDEMTRLSLGQFIAQQRGTDGAPTVVSVPGNAAFARFAKLPPVEPKKVPDIVKFEAVQQIPFPIDDVEWDYETFISEDSPDVEVGIFAMTKQAVQAKTALYGELGMMPDGLTISPIAVYNGLVYDLELDDSSGGVIFLDIGTESTDLIIAEHGRCWIRTFPVGGHNFTDALISSFKLTYSKAEKLKSEAQTSKYRRQILSAMRPVFADLAQDVQRSIGYYQSMHSDADLKKLVGVGSTFKLPGLRKFLGQQLQMEVVRVDEYKRLSFSGASNKGLADHAVNFATAYGLALQGLDEGAISVNLIPVPVVRERLWHAKIKWFGAAAAVGVVAGLVNFIRPMADQGYITATSAYQPINTAKSIKQQFDEITKDTEIDAQAENLRKMLAYRDIWPQVVDDLSAMMANAHPQAALFGTDSDAIAAIPPEERRSITLESMTYVFKKPDDSGDSASGKAMPHIKFKLQVSTTNKGGVSFVNRNLIAWLTSNSKRPDSPYVILTDTDNKPKIQQYSKQTVTGEGDDSLPPSGGGMSRSRGRGVRGGKGGLSMGEGEGGGGFGVGEGGGGGRFGGGGNRIGGSINEMAPLPKSADILPAGTVVYRMEIVFEIELLPWEERFGDNSAGEEDQQ